MTLYQPPSFHAPIDLDLSRNEGRPILTELDLDIETFQTLSSRYPDTARLTSLVARRHGVDEERVLVTAGGDDAIFRCFLRSKGPVVSTTPTFEMVPRYAEQTGAHLTEIPWWGCGPPVDEIASFDAEMAVIVSPNNPTGSVIDESDLLGLAEAFPTVLLDAAYAEFADVDLTPLALNMENVVVVRTLSKAFGLAGLRVGYLLGSPEMVADIKAYGSPYAVSGLSAALAAKALETGMQRAQELAREVAFERDLLVDLLAELGARPLVSQANFALATDVDPEWLVPTAASMGVGLRRFPDHPDLGRCVRIGLPGEPDQFQRLVSVLRTALAPENSNDGLEVADVT